MQGKRYDELYELDRLNKGRFLTYTNECGRFRQELVSTLTNYLQSPEQAIWSRRYEELTDDQMKEQGFVEFTRDKRMALCNDGSYEFFLVIDLHRSSASLPVKVRQDRKDFVAQIGDKKWKIDNRLKEEDLAPVVAYLYDALKQDLETKFEDLVTEKSSNFGFLSYRPRQQDE